MLVIGHRGPGQDACIVQGPDARAKGIQVPKVLIECGNMRNATDAARLARPSFQRLAARALAEAIAKFLES